MHPSRTHGTGNVPWGVAFLEHLFIYKDVRRYMEELGVWMNQIYLPGAKEHTPLAKGWSSPLQFRLSCFK